MKAVLLVGGVGTRMRPLTYVMPKCLLPVGGKPLVEGTIAYLKGYGISDFVLCVAYLKKQIMDAIGDGSRLGVKVEYAKADAPLGTAGQLKTAEPLLDESFIVMNGDIITSLNIARLLGSHRRSGAVATIAVKKYGVKIPYGHITVDNSASITAFEEKPTLHYLANAGVYVMEPRLFQLIPAGRQTSLEKEIFPLLLSKGEKVNSYFEEASWADVGSMADFERVNDEVLQGSPQVNQP